MEVAGRAYCVCALSLPPSAYLGGAIGQWWQCCHCQPYCCSSAYVSLAGGGGVGLLCAHIVLPSSHPAYLGVQWRATMTMTWLSSSVAALVLGSLTLVVNWWKGGFVGLPASRAEHESWPTGFPHFYFVIYNLDNCPINILKPDSESYQLGLSINDAKTNLFDWIAHKTWIQIIILFLMDSSIQ